MTSKARKRPPASATPPAEAPAPAPIPSYPMAGGQREHPALGLGLWALGRWTREDEVRTRATIERALARGVPWFDTAEVYGAGRSERILGDLLARRPPGRPEPFLATKVSWEHLRAPMVRTALLGSLQRLSRPSVDLYLIHAPDPHVPVAETLGAMELLHTEGRIGALGVSNFGPSEVTAALGTLKTARLAVDQVRYSLFEPDEGDALLPLAKEHGFVIEAYTPLARGLLAGRYLDGPAPSPTDRQFARDLFDRDRFKELRERGRAIRRIAEHEGVPMASLALHWLARKGVAPVFGASQPDQVDEALKAWAIRPSDGALERAEEAARGRGAA